ncbi:MAG: outer membrane lipoprotein-sorting protein [Deferrisomatales bacterium]
MKAFSLSVAVFVMAVGISGAEPLAPDAVVARTWELYRQAVDEEEHIEIEIVHGGGRTEKKALLRWTRYDPSGEDRVSIRFLQPALDAGLGLLVWRHPEGTDDQWLKLPSVERVRRVAAGDQGKYFAGTDLTYEDTRQLTGERTGDFRYQLLREEGSARVIEATPREGVSSSYGRRRLWVDERFAVTRIEYDGKDGRLVKMQTHDEVEVTASGLWRPQRVEVRNLLFDRMTVLRVTARKLNSGIAPDVFTAKALERRQ